MGICISRGGLSIRGDDKHGERGSFLPGLFQRFLEGLRELAFTIVEEVEHEGVHGLGVQGGTCVQFALFEGGEPQRPVLVVAGAGLCPAAAGPRRVLAFPIFSENTGHSAVRLVHPYLRGEKLAIDPSFGVGNEGVVHSVKFGLVVLVELAETAEELVRLGLVNGDRGVI